MLSIGIALTGLVTFAHFSVASYVLDDVAYTQISLLWSLLFIIVSVIYRPIEQLLSRTIADRRARGLEHDHPLRTPLTCRRASRSRSWSWRWRCAGRSRTTCSTARRRCTGSSSSRVLAYAASYFARGWLAGHQWFGFYGGLVFLEAISRLAFAVAVAVGIAEGQSAVALGMAAAPFFSLVVVPWAFSRRPPARRSASATRTTARPRRAAGASRSPCSP